jgi:hypothetical protein
MKSAKEQQEQIRGILQGVFPSFTLEASTPVRPDGFYIISGLSPDKERLIHIEWRYGQEKFGVAYASSEKEILFGEGVDEVYDSLDQAIEYLKTNCVPE